jgi:hypothetical protein
VSFPALSDLQRKVAEIVRADPAVAYGLQTALNISTPSPSVYSTYWNAATL